MSLPLTIGAGKCVFIAGADANGNPECYPYSYPSQPGYPVDKDIFASNCEIIGVAPTGGAAGTSVEYVNHGLVEGAGFTPGQPVYCADNGSLSSSPGSRVIRMGHAVSEGWAYIRVRDAE